jgi:hypothetical protein
VSHLVGTLETTRLLQLWKQRSDQVRKRLNVEALCMMCLARSSWGNLGFPLRCMHDAIAAHDRLQPALRSYGRSGVHSNKMPAIKQTRQSDWRSRHWRSSKPAALMRYGEGGVRHSVRRVMRCYCTQRYASLSSRVTEDCIA